MDHEVLDTRKAFQPGSGFFGWMLVPDAKVIVEANVNHKQKVVAAIQDLEGQQKDVAYQRQRLAAAEQAKKAAEQNLIRTLRAFYGDLSPAQWQLVSDVLFLAAYEVSRWSHQTDDAMRIPDMLSEASEYMRKQAALAAGGEV